LKKVFKKYKNFSFFSRIKPMKRDGVKFWNRLWEVTFGRTDKDCKDFLEESSLGP